MNSTASKSVRILKGVAIGLACLFLVLSACLIVKYGNRNDSMEQNAPTVGTYTPAMDAAEEAVPPEDDISEVTVPATEPEEEQVPAAEVPEETEPVEEDEEEDSKQPGSSSSGKKPSGGNSSTPAESGVITVTGSVTAENNVVTEEASFSDNGVSATVSAGTLLDNNTTKLTLTVKEKKSSDSGVKAEAGQTLQPLDVHMDGVSAANTQPITVCLGKILPGGMNIGNVTLYHVENGTANAMTQVMSAAELDAHNEFYYDPATGNTTVAMASFSEVAVVSEEAVWKGEIDTKWYTEAPADATTYEIFNADQLAGLGQLVDGGNTFAGKTVRLMLDVNLGGDKEKETGISFNPIGYGYEFFSGKVFKGTFDGNGNTISNLYQNGWDLESKTGEDYTYSMAGGGLFASVVDATIKNLTVENAHVVMECVDMGVVVGYANGDCTFENIVVKNSLIANYQRATGGAIGEVGNGHHELKNVDVDKDTVVSSLWGDFDAPLGGIIGGKWGHTYTDNTGHDGHKVSVYMEKCDVAAQINAYNDVTSAYQWYSYRRAGMLIGYSEESQKVDGRTEATASYLTTENCTVSYGAWADYHYCEFKNTTSLNARYPWVRVEEGFSNGAYSNPRYGNPVMSDGIKINTDNHESYHRADDGHNISIKFNQLYGGGQGCYGGNGHIGDGVTVITAPAVAEKFAGKGLTTVTSGTTVTLGDLFTGIEGADIQNAYVYAFVSPVDANTTARGTQVVPTANRNWEDLSITFSGEGKVKVTINDYYYCDPTEIIVEIVPIGSYVKTDLSNINSTDKVIITMTTSDGKTYALNSANGTSAAPDAVSVMLVGEQNNIISTKGLALDTLTWNISNNDGELVIYPHDTTDSWLYCINNNNGVRVGVGEDKTFKIDSTYGYLFNNGQNRYIGVYSKQDWRSYTTTPEDNNIKEQTLAFYKFTAGVVEPEPSEPEEPDIPVASDWTLVTDASTLKAGDQVVIVAKDSNIALSTEQKTNNRGAVSVTKSDNSITVGNDVQILTLEAGTVDGTFAFYTGDGYLYAASSSANNLKTQASNDANSSWTITVAANGTATITAQGSYTRNVMQYNPNNGSPLFACYGSASQQAVSLYVKPAKTCDEHTYDAGVVTAPTCTVGGYTTYTCIVCSHSYTDDEVDATGHTEVIDEAVVATCTATGLTEGRHCSVCSEVIVKQEEVPTLEHIDEDSDNICDRDGCGETMSSGGDTTETETVTMDIFANKGTLDNKVITWTSGDVTFQNAQGSSTTAIRTSDADHYRVYASSTVTISVASGTMTQIAITCTSSSYATVMQTSLTNAGYTATVSGSVVTVTVDSEESITFTASAQTRLNKIEVTYAS